MLGQFIRAAGEPIYHGPNFQDYMPLPIRQRTAQWLPPKLATLLPRPYMTIRIADTLNSYFLSFTAHTLLFNTVFSILCASHTLNSSSISTTIIFHSIFHNWLIFFHFDLELAYKFIDTKLAHDVCTKSQRDSAPHSNPIMHISLDVATDTQRHLLHTITIRSHCLQNHQNWSSVGHMYGELMKESISEATIHLVMAFRNINWSNNVLYYADLIIQIRIQFMVAMEPWQMQESTDEPGINWCRTT
jgi:hypothetical protein